MPVINRTGYKMADDLPEGWEKRQSRSTEERWTDMTEELVQLKRHVRKLEGQLLGYATLEDIFQKKSDLLTAMEVENKFLKKTITDLKIGRDIEKSPNSTALHAKSSENDVPATIEISESLCDVCLDDHVDDGKPKDVEGSIVAGNNSQETCGIGEILTKRDGDNNADITPQIRDKTDICESEAASPNVNNTEMNIDDKEPIYNVVSGSVKHTANMHAYDSECVAVSQHGSYEGIRQTPTHPPQVEYEKCTKRNNSVDCISRGTSGLLINNQVECETPGVHLVSRCPVESKLDEKGKLVAPHKYVNVDEITHKDNHAGRRDVSAGIAPTPCPGGAVDSDLRQILLKHDFKPFEITLSEGDDSGHISKRIVNLLKCLDFVEEECAVHRNRIVALEKENKYLRKSLYHQKILDIDLEKGDVFAPHGEHEGNLAVDQDLLRRYHESQASVKQLTLKLVTMKNSMRQLLQNGNSNLASKDKTIKDLKKKLSDEQMTSQRLHERLNERFPEQLQSGPISVGGRTESVVVNDLLSEINVLHQQMVMLTEDFKEEQKDKSRLKTSQASIQRKLLEVKAYVAKLENQLDSSEKNLHEALKMNDKLQESVGVNRTMSRKPLPTIPHQEQETGPKSLLLEENKCSLPGNWSCSSCTYLNHPKRTVCDLCGLLKKPPRPTKRRHTTTIPAENTINKAYAHGKFPPHTASDSSNGNSLNLPYPNSSINGISPLSEHSSLWDMQEEQIRLLTPESKPYRLVPRGGPVLNCDI